MLRLIGFFVLAVLLASLLGHVPVIGPLFARTGCLGIWLTALLLSWLFTRYGERAYRMRRYAGEVRRLAAVDSAYNQGKLGSLYLKQGRARRALEPLRRAVEGEPETAEWRYRLGCALLTVGKHDEAAAELRRCVELEEEYAFGAAQMRLAEALARQGHDAEALAALERFERNHGPSPESAYRRGLAHRAVGARERAKEAFDEVSGLARAAVGFQRRSAGWWSLRAQIARLF